MQQSIIVIDNFYSNPLKIRDLALQLEYKADAGHTYPGVNSKQSFFPESVSKSFLEILGSNIMPATNMLCGNFRLSNATDTFKQDIHVDQGADWAGVLFLNLPDQCLGGTSFWKHRRTGLIQCPRTIEEGIGIGMRSFKEVQEKFIYEDGLDRSLWDLSANIEMVFNRLVLFRPWLWHSHSCNFGTNKFDSRLVQLFFFNEYHCEKEKEEIKISSIDQQIRVFKNYRMHKPSSTPEIGTEQNPVSPKYFFEE